ncbi:MAG: hypothetical protein RDU41_10320 [Clostridia bacterium]|nr:hypothetical protein [Clostridia bacterium]
MRDKVELKVGYEGQLYQMDLDTLLISLLHLAEILKAISKKDIPPEALGIAITATERGSFTVFLELTHQVATTVATLFPDAKSAAESLSRVAAGFLGLLALKKLLKGEKPDKVEVDNNTGTVVVAKDGSTVNVSQTVYHVYAKNPVANDHLEKMFERLSDNPEVSGFNVEAPKIGRFSATSEEFPGFANNNELIQDQEKTELIENAWVSVLKVVFQKSRKWEFIFNGEKISALIADERFWQQVDAGKQFGKGDALIVDLEAIKVFEEELNCYVTRSYKVVRVLEHHPRSKQLPLF